MLSGWEKLSTNSRADSKSANQSRASVSSCLQNRAESKILQVAARRLDGECKDQIRKKEVAMTGSSNI